ncbi:response regulator transcription factor [Candidatus Methylomirabilis sp.]|uniref:Response regulator transcription factor n=1 Tax=Candidatus Methylomirabilis tolerans TaxID=3123416 RepID=A0AAJ1EK76_9BACT|nr:response regulator transcription factor [Candidatus Methylomirabilis sp.]
MSRITVLIADDHAPSREGLRLVLAQENGIQVVDQATDGKQALTMMEALQPDILLLNVHPPVVKGLDALSQIRAKSPGTKVLILADHPGDNFIIKALQCGAKGCLSKTLTRADIIKAIRVTHAGELWAERKMLAQTLESLLQTANAVAPTEAHKTLTKREREIIKWVMQGMTNKEIAVQLEISDKTVKTHLSNIFGKLQISHRLQLLLSRIVNHTA